MNASTASALLAQRAESVCARYLPHGRKQGRYWCAGDVRGTPGRSLFVRLAPPGIPGKFTDAATGEHGDLLDLIRLATGAHSLREALAEARRFLAQPVAPASSGPDTYDRAQAARNLWDRCRPIHGTHAEAYLVARAIHRCRFPALRFHPALPYRPDAGGWQRLPALVAAVTADDGNLQGVHRTWLDPRRPAKARVSRPRKALGRVHGLAVRFGEPDVSTTLLVGEGIETVLSLISAWPDTRSRGAPLQGPTCRAQPRSRLPRFRRAASARSFHRPASRTCSSRRIAMTRASASHSGSNFVVRASASPRPSSCPRATTSTTIS